MAGLRESRDFPQISLASAPLGLVVDPPLRVRFSTTAGTFASGQLVTGRVAFARPRGLWFAKI